MKKYIYYKNNSNDNKNNKNTIVISIGHILPMYVGPWSPVDSPMGCRWGVWVGGGGGVMRVLVGGGVVAGGRWQCFRECWAGCCGRLRDVWGGLWFSCGVAGGVFVSGGGGGGLGAMRQFYGVLRFY